MLFDSLRPARPRPPALAHGAVVEVEGRPVRLKVHPRDQAENHAVLARAERLYEERLGDEREQVARLIDQFRFVLDSQDRGAAAAFRTEFIAWLDRVDHSFFE